ncbi:MAG: hypothetical protein BZY81_07015 [SAR202 cluster bacterium Io17-Chloro-G4]|nr:MAG: hypothetical protein BZY81_07015 [SAR202 cluster bacterium Io17-Chloro-G4]
MIKCPRVPLWIASLAVVFATAVVLAIIQADLSGSAALAQSSQDQKVTLSVTSVSYNEAFQITLEGFPSDLTLPAGSVSFAGMQVPIPGVFGVPGVRPVADERGALSFTTALPTNADIGFFQLTVEVPPLFSAKTVLRFRGSSLKLSSDTVVPNQVVYLRGSGFAALEDDGELVNPNRITGNGSSLIIIDGKPLRPPHVDYPIRLDKNGSFFVRIIVPDLSSAEIGNRLEIRVTDSSGRKGDADLVVLRPRTSFYPGFGYPGQNITLSGQGFIASNRLLAANNRVEISYWV